MTFGEKAELDGREPPRRARKVAPIWIAAMVAVSIVTLGTGLVVMVVSHPTHEALPAREAPTERDVATGTGRILMPKTTSLPNAESRSLAIEFTRLLCSGDSQRAYALMSGRYRASVPMAEFSAAVRSNPYLKPRASADFLPNRERISDVQHLEGVLNDEHGQLSLIVDIVTENQTWVVTGITVAGLPAVPGWASPRPDEAPPYPDKPE
jgi:hypothetical protein